MIHTQEQVINIAFDSGFTSVTRFYEVFSRYYQKSPLQYRKRHSHLNHP
ncbi:helix-turn-helix domain-containing protein [Hahella ganghwensis]